MLSDCGIIRIMAEKVALGMSGGVDSSTAAWLLQEQGYDVTGVYLAGLYPGPGQETAIRDAREVAAKLGIDFVVLDASVQAEWLRDYFVNTYQNGKTPNVCSVCNKRLKFGFFVEWAQAHNFSLVATGHYARIQRQEEQFYLKTATDTSKDQSYFLGLVDREIWTRVLFPVGGWRKTEIRQKAAQIGLPVADKPESMDVCFLQNQETRDYLSERVTAQPGAIVTLEGVEMGRHRGLPFYTIGQRQGLEIQPSSNQTPVYYVAGKDARNNRLLVGTREQVCQNEVWLTNTTKALTDELTRQPNVSCWRVRLRHQGQMYQVAKIDRDGGQTRVILQEPAFGVSPGQFAVFYAPDSSEPGSWLVMGAGEIISDVD